jgi:hypothetical protein
MSKSLTSENLRDAFTYPFQDPKWFEKFLIGSLFILGGFLILPLFLIYGYFAEMLRNAIEGKELSLPEWDEWEKKFTEGAKLFLVGLIYVLPLGLFFLIIYIFLLAGAIGPEYIDYDNDLYAPIWAIVSMIGTFGWMVLFGLGLLVTLVFGAISPAMICHVVVENDFSAAFRIREWWSIFRANLSGFAVTYLLVLGLITALNFIYQFLVMTVILCCFSPFILIPGTFYIMTAVSVLFGQAYKEGIQNLST